MRIKLNEYNNIEYCYNRLAIPVLIFNPLIGQVSKYKFSFLAPINLS